MYVPILLHTVQGTTEPASANHTITPLALPRTAKYKRSTDAGYTFKSNASQIFALLTVST